MEVDHAGKRCGSTHTWQAGVSGCSVALLWSQREGSRGQAGREVWAAFLCPHVTPRLRGCCGHRGCVWDTLCTHTLVSGQSDGAQLLWLVPLSASTPGLAVNYTLESRVSVCAAVGPAWEGPKLVTHSVCSCSCGRRGRAVTLYLHPRGFSGLARQPLRAAATACAAGWVCCPLGGFYRLCVYHPEHSTETTASCWTLVVTNSPINAVSQISLGRQSQPTRP